MGLDGSATFCVIVVFALTVSLIEAQLPYMYRSLAHCYLLSEVPAILDILSEKALSLLP